MELLKLLKNKNKVKDEYKENIDTYLRLAEAKLEKFYWENPILNECSVYDKLIFETSICDDIIKIQIKFKNKPNKILLEYAIETKKVEILSEGTGIYIHEKSYTNALKLVDYFLFFEDMENKEQ